MREPNSMNKSSEAERLLSITNGLSPLRNELFDLAVAAINYLASFDISTIDLISTITADDVSAQEILEAIINELEDFCGKNLANVPFEFQPYEKSGFRREKLNISLGRHAIMNQRAITPTKSVTSDDHISAQTP